ncbi:MAG: hypothetical protein AAF513_10525 [Pseudomonadota bacterium]
MLRFILLTGLLLLSACDRSPPSGSWELAAQGLYTGALSPDAQFAVVGSLNHGASLWRVADRERLYNWSHAQDGYSDLVAAAFSPDGSRAVTTDPRTLVLWNANDGSALNFWGTPGTVLDVAVHANNREVLLGLDDHSAVLFDAVSGNYNKTFMHLGEVGSVALAHNGALALTGSDDNTAVLWNTTSGEAEHVFQHDNPVRAVALSYTGKLAFTAAQGDLVAIWRTDTGQRLHALHNGINHGARTATFSRDEKYLAVGYTRHKVALYSTSSGALLKEWDCGRRHQLRATGATVLTLGFGENPVNLFALIGDGRLLHLRASS